MKIIKVKGSNEIPKNFTGVVIRQKQGKFWFKEGKYHREDGPAVELTCNGEKHWFLNGKLTKSFSENGIYDFWF